MKSKLVIKFLLALSFGAIIGQLVYLDQERWHRLGREAFLAHQANRFDQHTAAAAGLIIFCAIFMLGLRSLYEGAAFAILKLVTRVRPRESAAPGVSS